MSEISARVAANVRAVRLARGFTVSQLAELIEPEMPSLTGQVIHDIETGRRRRGVTVEQLAALARELRIGEPWTLTEELCSICSNAPPPGLRCLSCGTGAMP